MANEPFNGLARQWLGKHSQALDAEEINVLRKIAARLPIAQDAADVADARATFGERLSDKMAASLDYEVDLRAELGILRIHEKLDLAINERLDRVSVAPGAHREG